MRLFGTEISPNRVRGRELIKDERLLCLSKLQDRKGPTEVAEELGCARSCVYKIKQRFLSTYNFESRVWMGRLPKLTRREHRLLARAIKKFLKMQFLPLMKEAGFWDSTTNKPTLSPAILAREMAEEELYHFRAKRRPKISKNTARLRLKLAARLLTWDFERGTIKFSDECSVARGSGHNTTWVWRLPSKKWAPKNVEEVPCGRQAARMVWGCIWLTEEGEARRSPLVIMKRDPMAPRKGYTAKSYIKALCEGLLPSYEVGELFLQDNARIHTAEVTMDWLDLHDVSVLDWPPYSPDLNPIEHMWLALKRTLHKLHPKFDTMGESVEEWEAFEMGLKEAWATIPDELIKKLILSMPRRLEACRVSKGF